MHTIDTVTHCARVAVFAIFALACLVQGLFGAPQATLQCGPGAHIESPTYNVNGPDASCELDRVR